MNKVIRELRGADLECLLQHMAAHQQESGRDGDPIFMPYSASDNFEFERQGQTLLAAWAKGIEQSGWRRELGCFIDKSLAGHLSLYGADLPAGSHRVSIGVGVLRRYRKQGIGRSLVREGLDWLRGSGHFDWVDLGVFAHNRAAYRLYQGLGFVETGRLDDRFRVDGQCIDDIQMSLRL